MNCISVNSHNVASMKRIGTERNYAMPKKFRTEWMQEQHFKDWLQPHAQDDSLCVCTACNVVLRCGKSELDKHATGLKHTKRVEHNKGFSNDSEGSSQLQNNPPTLQLEQFFDKHDDQVWIGLPVTSHAELSMEEDVEATADEAEAIEFLETQPSETSSFDTKLTEALVKLFEFADGKVDLSKKRLEMLQEEHALKVQILKKELRLKNLEVEIKEVELKKLRLETLQNNVKENQVPQSQLTINDHHLQVISEQNLQDALQVHLQQFQNQFENQHSQESKGVNGALT